MLYNGFNRKIHKTLLKTTHWVIEIRIISSANDIISLPPKTVTFGDKRRSGSPDGGRGGHTTQMSLHEYGGTFSLLSLFLFILAIKFPNMTDSINHNVLQFVSAAAQVVCNKVKKTNSISFLIKLSI